jgi:glycosyltransferase involved in cell wall biosynthesis
LGTIGRLVHACTIVAPNYLPAARVLAASFLAHHPGGSFTVLLLDEPAQSSENFEVLSPYDIGIERSEVHRMAMIYDVKEFATAVKPWLLKTLLARDSTDVALYFDPDIEVFAPVEDVAELAREHSIVLTPHTTAPFPNDGLLPDDLMILQAGTYNLGFIAVGPGANEFLDWWSWKLARDCLVAVNRGQFVDQRWADFVPVLFDHTVLRDRTCNVAYWNLHERSVRWTGERYEVEGRPLRFFHFSGFDPMKADRVSTHLATRPRILLGEHPDLARLCRGYARRVLEQGYVQHRHFPYRYDRLARGVLIDPRMRRIFREALEQVERDSAPDPPDPFDPASAEAFLDWLKYPVGPGGLSRYLYVLLVERSEKVGRLHVDQFRQWVETIGRHEEKIPAELLPAVRVPPRTRLAAAVTRARLRLEQRLRAAAARYPVLMKTKPLYRALERTALRLPGGSPPGAGPGAGDLGLEIATDPSPGINAVGYLRAELGVGEPARKLIAGIEHAAIPFSTITYDNTVNRQKFPFVEQDAGRVPYDTNLVCVNADQLPVFADAAGLPFFAGRYTIGVWFWELELFPARFHRAFDLVNEVWVGSDFVRQALTSETRKPVHVVPLPLEAPTAQPIQRNSLGLPNSFLFFFTFDFMSIAERKNPLALVAAFKQAFMPGEGAALVIKSINGERHLSALERLTLAASEHRDIHVLDGYLSPAEKDGLMAGCDCYVSLHRSEGLGLTMAEAMSYGKPVIATGYSGNLEFMNDENSYLVTYTLTQVERGSDPYPAGALWAEPDLAVAASLMRHVYDNQHEARERGERARQDIVTHHSLDRTAEFISGRFAEIHRDARAVGPGVLAHVR